MLPNPVCRILNFNGFSILIGNNSTLEILIEQVVCKIMLQYTSVLFLLLLMVIHGDCLRSYVNSSHPRPWKVIYYPKKTIFQKADLIDTGCVTFIKKCPRFYKRNMVCARHYDGHYKTFDNYCEMEYENCNSWRQWSLFKQVRC